MSALLNVTFYFVSLVGISSSISVAYAQENWDFAAPYKDRCSAGTMLDMTECLQKELLAVEERLNREYRSLLNSLVDPEPLKRAQAAWLRFREAECEFGASGIAKGGSLRPFAIAACKIDIDEKRIRDLQQYASWEGAGALPRKRPMSSSKKK